MSKVYDVIVLGAGPAGLAAGLYAGRSRLSTLVIEKGKDGGQIAITDDIENYPGQIVEGESGPSLIARMTQQCEKFGVERASDVINEVHLDGDIKVLKSAKAEYQSKTVIIATGAFARPIGCKGEGQFRGKGVSYCATCDGAFFRGKDVAVVGGGNTALEDALFLSDYCNLVYVVHRRNEFRGEKGLTDILKEKAKGANIEFTGHKEWPEIKEIVGKARFSVVPSEWYENNPLSVIEAQCLGTPVLGANIGGIPELIKEGVNGMCFESRNIMDLKNKIEKMFILNVDYKQLAKSSQIRYSSEKHYNELLELYQQ